MQKANFHQSKTKLKPRKSGTLKGKIFVSDDFDKEDEAINKSLVEKSDQMIQMYKVALLKN